MTKKRYSLELISKYPWKYEKKKCLVCDTEFGVLSGDNQYTPKTCSDECQNEGGGNEMRDGIATKKTLKYMREHPNRDFCIFELVEILGFHYSTIHKAIRTLIKRNFVEIVKKERNVVGRGRTQNYYKFKKMS